MFLECSEWSPLRKKLRNTGLLNNACLYFCLFIVFLTSRPRPTRTFRTKIRRHVAPPNLLVQHSIVRTPTAKAAPAVDRGSRNAAVRVRVLTASRSAEKPAHAVNRLAAAPHQRNLSPTRPSHTRLGRPRPAQTSPARLRAPTRAPALRLHQFRCPSSARVHLRPVVANSFVPTVYVCNCSPVRAVGNRRRRLAACPTLPSSRRPRPRASRPQNDRRCRNWYPSCWNRFRSTSIGLRSRAVSDWDMAVHHSRC